MILRKTSYFPYNESIGALTFSCKNVEQVLNDAFLCILVFRNIVMLLAQLLRNSAEPESVPRYFFHEQHATHIHMCTHLKYANISKIKK